MRPDEETMRRLPITSILIAATAAAQAPIPPQRFLPSDYKNAVHVDLEAMRDQGIWEDLEASVLKMAFGQIEKECGFPLARLDRLTMVADPGEPGGPASRVQEIAVFEGNAELGQPGDLARGSWQEDRIGAFDVRRSGGFRERLFLQPRPDLQVRGTADPLAALLVDEAHRGLPSADVMSLTSGRGKKLAWFVIDLTHPMLQSAVLDRLAPDADWPADGAPTFLCASVVATGEADDPHVAVEAVLRHAKAGEGVAVTEQAAKAFLARLAEDPQMRMVKPLLQKVDQRTEGADLVLRLDLGRARDAVGQLATLAMPLFPRAVAAQPAQVEEIEVVEEPPPPPQRKPQPKPQPNPGGGGDEPPGPPDAPAQTRSESPSVWYHSSL